MADQDTHQNELDDAARRSLSGFLESSGRDLDAPARDQIVRLAALVAHWGSRMNLSGFRDPESVMGGLICDALSLWFEAENNDEVVVGEKVVDLGSGAGFPGLPLAIIEPSVSVSLVDSRERRHHFQRAVRRDLGLENVDPRLGRIEDLDPTPSDLVIAQALAQPQASLELALPWLKEGGFVFIPANRPDPQIAPHSGIGKTGSFSYAAPAKQESRWLWWGQKVSRDL